MSGVDLIVAKICVRPSCRGQVDEMSTADWDGLTFAHDVAFDAFDGFPKAVDAPRDFPRELFAAVVPDIVRLFSSMRVLELLLREFSGPRQQERL